MRPENLQAMYSLFTILVTLQECGISSISGEQQDAHEALVKLFEAVHVGLSNWSWKICWLPVVHAWKQVAKLEELNVQQVLILVRSIIWVFFITSIKNRFSSRISPILTAKSHVKLALFRVLVATKRAGPWVVMGVGVSTKATGSWLHFKASNLGALQPLPHDLFTLAVQDFSTSVTVADDGISSSNSN